MANILVTDDEPGVRLVIRYMLEDAGHSVSEADGGYAALATLQQREFDLLITDLLMPQGGGIETIREIRRQRSQIPIIAISGGSGPQHDSVLDLAREVGVDQVLPKPFARKQLLERVQQLLGVRTPSKCHA